MKRALKITLITVASLIVLTLAAAVAIPFLFKDRLLAVIKEVANESLTATFDFSDASLTLFRSFPNLTVRLKDVTVDNAAPFEGIRLADVQSADLTLDIMSVIRNENPLRLKSIHIQQPKLNIYVLEDGRANYDIVIPSTDTTAVEEEPLDLSAFRANLEKYSINNANILYDDRSLGVYVSAKGLTHSGSGDFTIDVYDLDTRTDIDSLTLRYGGITYLKRAHTTLDAIFNIDQRNSKYTLKDNILKVNELHLNADGFVQLAEADDIIMDLTFSTPQNSFRYLLSMIPNAYIAGYEQVKADGQFELNGFVKGTYNEEREAYPAFQLNFGVENGNVKYPDLPLGINDIFAKVNINSPSSNFDDIVVNIPAFRMRLGNNPFRAVFNLKTPISDPDINTEIVGTLNLRELAQAFPIEGISDLNGTIVADVRAKTRLSYIENQQYERVNMDGVMEIKSLNYKDAIYPAVRINNAKAAFTPQHVRIDNFDAQLGKSDIKASGRVDNILAYFSPKKTMRGSMTVRSGYFDVNEWMPAEATAGPALPSADATAASTPMEIFDRFDFTLDAAFTEMAYDIYSLKNLVVKGNMQPNRLAAQDLSLQIGNSDLRVNGLITNLFDYLFDNRTLGGEINLASNLLDLNQFMTDAGATTAPPVITPEGTVDVSTEVLEPILVPDRVELQINADIKKLIYTNLELNNLRGQMEVTDQSVLINDATANLLGGRVALSGAYDTKDPANPAFTIKYDLKSMDFQKSFQAFNTFQAMAPIGEFIKGNYNTSLIMDGKLGKNMMPDLSTLNVKGFLETINGAIQNFKPLQAIGDKLNMDYFREELRITNSRNWFEMQNGAIEVQEFDYKYKDIEMRIGGSHSITQVIDYAIKAKIPRKLLEKTGVGAAASAGFDQLSKEANRFGINLRQSEFVNVQFNLTGDIKNPKVGMKLLGADGSIVAEESPAEAAKEALTKEAEARMDAGKQAVKEATQEAIDSARTVLGQKAEAAKDSLARKAEEALRDRVGTALDSTLQKQGVDKIKEELDKFNPLKRKKSGEN
ncbi:MAG TPA: AsmA-like C-terminal region-containing protein [Saprospiraceae bacterium]|nr:AsmA-like C-terminal region-containing protein [Saprospiraceae bacterium]HMP24032.1 AsmA-like C-terminal region-containing protein [Saprospiraceae bacterium]